MGQMDRNSVSERELALERTELSHERTELSVLRTELSFQNSRLSVQQTHLSFLRTIVSLVGSAATVYKALPAIGVSGVFSTGLAVFLLASALYFTVKDIRTYPSMKRSIEEMEKHKDELVKKELGED